MKKGLYKPIFYTTYFLYLILNMCSKVIFISPFLDKIFYTIIILLLLIVVTQSNKYTKKSMALILFLILLSFTVYIVTNDSVLIFTSLFIITTKNIDTDEFIKKDVAFKILIIFAVIICYKLNLTSAGFFARKDGTIRNTLGFDHPNHLGLYLFSVCCGIGYLKHKNYKIIDYIILLTSFIICYLVCDSRASQIGIIIIALMIKFSEKIGKNKKILWCTPIIFFVLSLTLSILYTCQNQAIIELDKSINSRIMYASKFLQYYNVNLFGNNFIYYGNKGANNYLDVLDNGYIHILLHYGLISFSIIMMSYVLIIKKAIKEEKYNILIYIIPFLTYGLIERHIYEIQYNSILIMLSSFIYFKNYNVKKEET